MAKNITFEYGGRKYKLEYTRQTCVQIMREGFDASSLGENNLRDVLESLPLLFKGAFYKYHSGLSEKTIDDIYSHMPNKAEMFQKLGEMFREPIEALMAEPKADDEKNISWGASF